jgi:hypothetical protein
MCFTVFNNKNKIVPTNNFQEKKNDETAVRERKCTQTTCENSVTEEESILSPATIFKSKIQENKNKIKKVPKLDAMLYFRVIDGISEIESEKEFNYFCTPYNSPRTPIPEYNSQSIDFIDE